MPIFEGLPVEQVQSILMIQRRALESTPVVQVDFCMPTRTTLVQARNEIIREAVDGEYTHLCWLDDDNPVQDPYEAIASMLEFMESKKDCHVVSGLIKSRDDSHFTIYSSVGEIGQSTPQYEPFVPALTENPWVDQNTYEPFQADAIGFGFVLMDRESFTAVYKKYHGYPVSQWLTAYTWIVVDQDKDWEQLCIVELADAFLYYQGKPMDGNLRFANLSENFLFRHRLTMIDDKYRPWILPNIQCFHIAKKYVSCDLK